MPGAGHRPLPSDLPSARVRRALPRHAKIKRRLLQAILAAAGIAEDDFLDHY